MKGQAYEPYCIGCDWSLMKLENVPNGSEDCPLIRLFDFDEEECEQIRLLLSQLAAGKLNQAELHEAEFVEPVDSCKVTLLFSRLRPRNR